MLFKLAKRFIYLNIDKGECHIKYAVRICSLYIIYSQILRKNI